MQSVEIIIDKDSKARRIRYGDVDISDCIKADSVKVNFGMLTTVTVEMFAELSIETEHESNGSFLVDEEEAERVAKHIMSHPDADTVDHWRKAFHDHEKETT